VYSVLTLTVCAVTIHGVRSGIGMSTLVHISPPGPFDFNFPNTWCSWVKRFKRYRQASTFHEEEGKKQVNLLMYLLGRKGEDVLSSFNLTNEEVENYNVVVARFSTYFNVRTNVIYERAVFNFNWFDL